MSTEEKQSAEHVEVHDPIPSDSRKSEDDELLASDVRPAAERRLVRMLDMRLLPTIIVIFIMNYIDVSVLLLYPAASEAVFQRRSTRAALARFNFELLVD